MKVIKFITILLLSVITTLSKAQTPVQDLISKFDSHKGVKVMEIDETFISLARRQIRKSPLEPLADNVTELTILVMKKSSEQTKEDFNAALQSALTVYQFYGKKEGIERRIVNVYGDPVRNDAVHELIVFNPKEYSLFSLRGVFPVQDLMALDKK